MGSFNTSCFVTQQVIIPGSEVIILPIHQQSTYKLVELSKNNKQLSKHGCYSTTCYPTAFWGYAGPLFHAIYDDYGNFEIPEIKDNKINLINFFNYLSKSAFTTAQGENKYHDHGFDIHNIYNAKENYTFEQLIEVWDKVWEVAGESRLFIEDYDGVPNNLQFAVMYSATADYLINYVSKVKNYNGQSYEQKTYFKNYIQSQLKRMIEIFKDKNELSDTFTFFSSQMASLSNYHIGEQEGCYLSGYYNSFNDIMDAVEDYHKNNPNNEELSDQLIDNLFKIFESQIQHRYIHNGLNNFGIRLTPMVYTPQDYDNSMGKAYAKMIKEVSSKVTKEIKSKQEE